MRQGLRVPCRGSVAGGALHVAGAEVERRPRLARVAIEHGHADVEVRSVAHVVQHAADLAGDQFALSVHDALV
jgi:hypothetical protein